MICAPARQPLKTADVEVHDLLPLVGGVVKQRGGLGDAGVVDNGVQAAHVLGGCLECLGHGVKGGKVAGAAPNLGIGVRCQQFLDCGVSGFLAGAKDGYNSALLDKAFCDRVADAAGAAGDNCLLAFQ